MIKPIKNNPNGKKSNIGHKTFRKSPMIIETTPTIPKYKIVKSIRLNLGIHFTPLQNMENRILFFQSAPY